MPKLAFAACACELRRPLLALAGGVRELGRQCSGYEHPRMLL